MAAKVLVLRSTMIAKEQSNSDHMTDRFLQYYRKHNPQDEIIDVDLNDLPMAQISLNRANLGTFFNEQDSDHYIEQLKQVHKIIVACPMTNFNVCATMKNYLDHILAANKTFSYKYSKKGEAIGLMPHLKVQILTTQGAPLGWYLFGDHTRNLKGTFEFIGAQVSDPVVLDGTKIPEHFKKTPKEMVDRIDSQLQIAAQKFAALPIAEWKPIV